MLTHEQVWAAIDALAEKKQLTASGLARNSGLDPTSFNKSKRHTSNGRKRWPSTESVAKALEATQVTMSEFVEFAEDAGAQKSPSSKMPAGNYPMPASQHVPMLGVSQVGGAGGFFDSGGYPAGQDWDEIHFPAEDQNSIYALEVSGDTMQPLYEEGVMLIVAPGASVRKGDKIVFKTKSGEILAKVLARKSARQIETHSGDPDDKLLTYPLHEIEWIARILWASQ
ncbi:MAG: helix-turn-helix transcriptional regulator [Rhizobiaceae bacterium]|nr:helix-turn-helix transcriptional regulator [Rhizobiaceae bacterium]